MNNLNKNLQDLEKEMKEFEENYDIPLNVCYYRELKAELSGITFAKEEMLKDEIEWLKSLNQNDIREITKDIRISQLQLKVRRR